MIHIDKEFQVFMPPKPPGSLDDMWDTLSLFPMTAQIIVD